MPLSQETSRALDYLRNIFESGKTLKLSEPHRTTNGQSYVFVVTAYGKEMNFCLTREQLDDVPGTKEYRDAADVIARGLEFRFRNCDPNLFVSASGRVLHISPEWPAMPLTNPGGTGYIAASGIRVLVRDTLSQEVAVCLVKITHMQALPGPQSTPFHRLARTINSIRSDVDAGKIVFYSAFEQHPKVMQNVDFRYDAKAPEGTSVSQYLQLKVWLLGFRCGRKESLVWIVDPWDAAYLGCPTTSLHQSASILEARDLIRLDESGDFASAGKSLLSQGGPQSHSVGSIEKAADPSLSDRQSDAGFLTDPAVPTAFMSYSWDTPEHKQWVLHLAERLRIEGGVNVILDHWHLPVGGDRTYFMEHNIQRSDFVLLVCTPSYAQKSNARLGGVGYEATILTGQLAQHITQDKFIPVLRIGKWDDSAIPIWLQTKIGVDFRKEPYSEEQYQLLLRALHQAQEQAPPIGPKPSFQAPTRIQAGGLLGNAVTAVLGSAGTGPEPAQSKMNAVAASRSSRSPEAYAFYEKKGTDARVQVFVRPVDSSSDLYSFETSTGEYEEGPRKQINIRYLSCDLDLKESGYTRMQSFNGTGGQRFNLP